MDARMLVCCTAVVAIVDGAIWFSSLLSGTFHNFLYFAVVVPAPSKEIMMHPGILENITVVPIATRVWLPLPHDCNRCWNSEGKGLIVEKWNRFPHYIRNRDQKYKAIIYDFFSQPKTLKTKHYYGINSLSLIFNHYVAIDTN